jgi:hypothetical protein
MKCAIRRARDDWVGGAANESVNEIFQGGHVRRLATAVGGDEHQHTCRRAARPSSLGDSMSM